MPLIRTVCALWYAFHLLLSLCVFMYIYAYMSIYVYTCTLIQREGSCMCRVLPVCPRQAWNCVAQAALSNPASSDSRALGLQSSAFFSPFFFPIALFLLELKCHKGNTWRKQVILGYQAVGKCLGKWAFLSVLREGEKQSHYPEKRT